MPIASRSSDQFNIRFPDGLRERIKRTADENRRSMNSEIVTILESVVGKNAETKKTGEAAA